MRKSEVAQASMGDFIKENNAWLLRVIGKGAKERLITCNSVMVDELQRYRTGLGLTPLPTPGERRPLVQNLRRHQPHSVTPRAIGLIIEEIRSTATSACDDPHIRDRINRMSAHWMRHTNATHRLQAGASLVTTQDELGHASINTTRAYTATSSQQRMDDAEKLANLSGRK
jgi:site-specific recombinase XerD